MLFAPSDEIVELKLGQQLGSWERIPPGEAATVIMIPDDSFILNALVILSFLVAGAAAIGGLILTKHAVPGLFTGVAVLGVQFFGLTKQSGAVYRSHRLGIFDDGIRYGKDLIRFEDLKLLSLEAPKSVTERHFPTFRKMQRKVDKFPELIVKSDRTRKLTVTPILNDGTHLVWLRILGMFSIDDLDAFYDLVKARYPEKVSGTNLTPEERQQIEAL